MYGYTRVTWDRGLLLRVKMINDFVSNFPLSQSTLNHYTALPTMNFWCLDQKLNIWKVSWLDFHISLSLLGPAGFYTPSDHFLMMNMYLYFAFNPSYPQQLLKNSFEPITETLTAITLHELLVTLHEKSTLYVFDYLQVELNQIKSLDSRQISF